MIKFCRIDDKLLHGQIVMAWTRYVGAEHIVVVNDEAAARSSLVWGDGVRYVGSGSLDGNDTSSAVVR